MIMSSGEMKAFREIFTNEKVDVLITTIEDIIPARKGAKAGSEEVLQI
jgi:hypothetical protein